MAAPPRRLSPRPAARPAACLRAPPPRPAAPSLPAACLRAARPPPPPPPPGRRPPVGVSGWVGIAGPGLAQHGPQCLADEVEVFLLADERGRQLYNRVAPVVGATDEAGVEQRPRQEAPQQPFGLVVVEGLPGVLVLRQFDP